MAVRPRDKDKRPSLHSERVRAATPGELEWLLKNGSMKNGMPSWSRLPEQQRWQIVSFLEKFAVRTLTTKDTKDHEVGGFHVTPTSFVFLRVLCGLRSLVFRSVRRSRS